MDKWLVIKGWWSQHPNKPITTTTNKGYIQEALELFALSTGHVTFCDVTARGSPMASVVTGGKMDDEQMLIPDAEEPIVMQQVSSWPFSLALYLYYLSN